MNAICQLLDPKIIKIVTVFSKNKCSYYHLNKLSKEAKVPLATTFRIINKLVDLKIVEITNIDNFKIYKFANNEITKEISEVVLQ